MPPEILALIDKPLSLLAVLFVGALAGMAVEQVVSKQRREAWKRRNAGRWTRKRRDGSPAEATQPRGEVRALPPFDAAEQLRCVMAAKFEKRPLLNKAEAQVLAAAERAVGEIGEGWRVMAQVCLGEILGSPDEAAYRAINSKRVDLLVIARNGEPLAAIEYQGGGHHQGTAAARDAVKKEALRRAGVEYIEIKEGDRSADLNWAIAKLAQSPFGRKTAAR
jgi:hypothetical protein